ncbi:MAG: biliverdin-producing heme oxygenase, partial [Candidatus Melainabacteria bacterium]|nr:biliverdin-producing heme oxygenase [Candidatus Melainabacteria bacterium]
MTNVIGGGTVKSSQATSQNPFGNWKRPPILDKLKTETDSRHIKLQQNTIFNGLLGKAPPLDRYRVLLEKFWGFYKPMEEKFGARSEWQASGFNFNERRKAHLIEKDLAFLSVTAQDIPSCDDLPEIESFEQALGCMYVLEGATLGAQQMARNFK